MSHTKNKKLTYEALESLCKDLQKQVSHSLKEKQDWLEIQTEMDWELSKTQSIQRFSEAAMRVENFKQLNNFTVQSFKKIFHEPNSVLFQFEPQKQRLYKLARFGFDDTKLPKSFHFLPLLLPKRKAVLIKNYPKLAQFFSFLGLREAIVCPFYNNEDQFSGLIVSGHTATEALFTEPILEKICPTYTIMTHNYGVLSGNFLLIEQLKHKVERKRKNTEKSQAIQKQLLVEQKNLKTTIREQEQDLLRINKLLETEITDVKRLQAELFIQIEKKSRTDKELEQLAYVASHDLKAPIRTIASFVQLLQKRCGNQIDEMGHNYMDFILAGVRRFDNVINDLIQYTKISQVETNLETVNLNTVIQNVQINLKETITIQNARLHIKELPILKSEPTLMELLFQHLLDNALKFTTDNTPEISITVQYKNGVYTFAIIDNGIGIEKRYQEKVFELFQQLHTEEAYDGTGIGLAVCKKIIDRHQGKIWVQSEKGQGTSIYFTLPDNLKMLH